MMVLDASVAAKWYLFEPDSDISIRVLHHPTKLIAPELIEIEVCAAITKAARASRITCEHAKSYLQRWLQTLSTGILNTAPNAIDLPLAYTVALETQHSLQDCLYLAMAQRLNIPLVTCDQEQMTKALKIGVQAIPPSALQQ